MPLPRRLLLGYLTELVPEGHLRAACDGTKMVAVARLEEDVGVAPPG